MAERFYITKDIDVLEFEAVNEWGYPRHKHHFFELTFVLKGSGQHILNDSIVAYKEGDLFFLTPKDEHEFVVSEPTIFGIIKFTEQLFLEKATFTSSTYWRKNLESVIFHSNIIAQSVIRCENDRRQLFRLYNLIRDELQTPKTYGRNVITELFGALLIVLSRNLKNTVKHSTPETMSDRDKVEAILTYIRQNALKKDMVKVNTIASTFHLSPNYVGIYIKKHLGISLKQYILETKMKMAESLLKQSNLNINEIADKLGFVDAAHFNRTFKKYTGKRPGDFYRAPL
ncbi:AraC family transcriptional regulator [Zhouia spongiae]|uniref:AraC family transcriptional regulator n=1 Tax=Zhouia spongiae TaxID=2202721 RepID=A0ABY3YMA1_9FLAO|nr:AraC family transcriptional regulator [Zhouia spongiae]UNY98283.1 AraC family transcriptional regulator [Zhouia spongiae]